MPPSGITQVLSSAEVPASPFFLLSVISTNHPKVLLIDKDVPVDGWT